MGNLKSFRRKLKLNSVATAITTMSYVDQLKREIKKAEKAKDEKLLEELKNIDQNKLKKYIIQECARQYGETEELIENSVKDLKEQVITEIPKE